MTQSTPTRMTRTITTRTTCTSEHSSAPLVCVSSSRVTPHWLKSSLSLSSSRHVAHVSSSLILFDLSFYFHLYFSVLFFSPSSCTLTCTPTSTTWNPWKITCTTPPRGATTPTTSPSPSQVMSPRTRSPASSSTPRVPSSALLRHQTRTWMTLRSASCSLKYTENTPITAVRKACLSVSRHCLSRPIERGNPWKRATSISLVLVSETRTVLTISFLQSPKLKMVDELRLHCAGTQQHRITRSMWAQENL